MKISQGGKEKNKLAPQSLHPLASRTNTSRFLHRRKKKKIINRVSASLSPSVASELQGRQKSTARTKIIPKKWLE